MGTGDAPFRYGVIGTGDAPFRYGVIGTGDAPLAITTEPSPCPITTVFKPIAPTKTNMVRSTIAASFLDILPPGMEYTRRHSIPYYRDVKELLLRTCSVSVHTYPARLFVRPSPTQMGPSVHYATRIGFRTYRVNSTVVLETLELKDSWPSGQVEQQKSTVTKEQSISNLTRLRRSCPRECLTPLRQTS